MKTLPPLNYKYLHQKMNEITLKSGDSGGILPTLTGRMYNDDGNTAMLHNWEVTITFSVNGDKLDQARFNLPS